MSLGTGGWSTTNSMIQPLVADFSQKPHALWAVGVQVDDTHSDSTGRVAFDIAAPDGEGIVLGGDPDEEDPNLTCRIARRHGEETPLRGHARGHLRSPDGEGRGPMTAHPADSRQLRNERGGAQDESERALPPCVAGTGYWLKETT